MATLVPEVGHPHSDARPNHTIAPYAVDMARELLTQSADCTTRTTKLQADASTVLETLR